MNILDKQFYWEAAKSFGPFFIGTLTVFWTFLEPFNGIDFFVPPGVVEHYLVRIYGLLLLTAFAISSVLSLLYSGYLRSRGEGKDGWCDKRSDFDHLGFLRNAEERVVLVGLSLAPFSTEEYVNSIENLVENGVHVRVLLLNPLSPNLCQRPKCLYEVNTDIGVAVTTTLKVLLKLKATLGQKHKAKLEVRVTNCIPHYGLFAVDDQVLWNPYLSTATGLDSPYLISGNKTNIGKSLLDDFESIWRSCCFEVTETTTTSDLEKLLIDDDMIYEVYPDKRVEAKVKTLLSM